MQSRKKIVHVGQCLTLGRFADLHGPGSRQKPAVISQHPLGDREGGERTLWRNDPSSIYKLLGLDSSPNLNNKSCSRKF